MNTQAARIPPSRRAASEPSQVLPVVWICVPSLLLAWSGEGAWISADPLPHLSGFALAALVSLIAALWVLVRGREPALVPSALLLCATLCGLAASAAGRVTDTLEAQRSWCAAALGFVLLAAGGSLRPAARANYGRALPIVSLAFTFPALLAHAFGTTRGLAGALGNTGALSLTALPGAAAGAWLAFRRPGAWRWVGLAAAAAFAAHALLAPVNTGVIALAVLLAALALSGQGTGSAQRGRWIPLACAALLVAAVFVPRLGVADARARAGEAALGAARADGAKPSASVRVDDAELGGFAVRTLLWRTLPRIVAHAPLLGLGPGQFQAAYPPLRDAREIELSTHGRSNLDFTEVEHLHSDWLQGIAEWGLIGGSAWILLLAAGLWAAWTALRGTDPTRAVGASALLPLLVAAAAHAPFTYVPAASAQGFALLGLLLAPNADVERPRWQRVSLRALPLVFGLLALPASLALLEHGRAITNRGAAVEFAAHQPTTDAAAARALEREFIDRAIAAEPRSAVAHALLARHLAQDPTQRERELEEWRRVLEQRPSNVEALFRCGLLEAAGGRDAAARDAWLSVVSIDPGEPSTRRNLALLEARAHDPGEAARHLDALEANARLSVDWLRSTSASEILRGRLEAGLVFAMRAEGWAKRPLAEELDAVGRARARVAADSYAEALRAAAQWAWGREQIEFGKPADAARNFRQALTATRRVAESGAPALRAELAAALDAAGRGADARAEIEGLRIDAELLRLLPPAVATRIAEIAARP